MGREAAMAGMGRLVVFLGAAAGVGKTYAMLGEARLAAEDGVDLVIGYLEPHGRSATEERARGLERAPVVETGPGGRAGTEMDVPWLLERRPSVVLVDELAHSYATGDPPRRRYEDVAELRRRGIEVWTTLNVQHLETLSDRVARLTGTTVRETVPDRLVHDADEVRLVDLSPAALRERIARGLVYPAPRVEGALTGFFTAANLAALRALVLHELAEAAAGQYEALAGGGHARLVERVMAVVDGVREGEASLVREATRVARRVDGSLTLLVVEEPGRADRAAAERRDALAQLAADQGASVLRRTTEDPRETIVREARDGDVTRLLLLHPDAGGLLRPVRLNRIGAVLRDLPGVHVVLVPRAL